MATFTVVLSVVAVVGTLYLLFFCGWQRYDPDAPRPMKPDRTPRVRCTTPVGNYGYWLDEGPPRQTRPTVHPVAKGGTTSL